LLTRREYTSFLAGNEKFIPSFAVGAYDSIATVTVGTAQSSITFSSIPATYTHLQVRGIVRPTSNNADMRLTLNSDSGSNYARHRLIGNGGSVDATGTASTAFIGIFDANGLQTGTASTFGVAVIDILDYANTSKYKTVRVLSGNDNNGSGQVGLSSGLWQNTSANSTITLVMSAGNFDTYSQFALYGIKGA
jgi:hypothetical protein